MPITAEEWSAEVSLAKQALDRAAHVAELQEGVVCAASLELCAVGFKAASAKKAARPVPAKGRQTLPKAAGQDYCS